jgi:hypothetical protein
MAARFLVGFVVSAALSAGVGCGAPTSPDDSPWMQALIAKLASEPAGSPPTQIIEYEYRNSLVYFVPVHQCCDLMSDLYDLDGHLMCHPDGGFAGQGDGRCADFLTQRSHARVVWSHTRRPA